MAGARLFQSLIGDWALSRVIDIGIGTMTGTARFRQLEPNLLHYREDGRLQLATGYQGDAHREYHWVLEDGVLEDGVLEDGRLKDGGLRDGVLAEEQIRVCFVEPGSVGRTLHTLRFAESAVVATDVHQCGQDAYTGRYRFDTPDRFTIEMTVHGPTKDYSTHTSYTRLR